MNSKHRTTIRTIRPGEVFGLLSLLEPGGRIAGTAARAVFDSQFVDIPARKFIQFASQSPGVLLEISSIALDGLALAEERLRIFGYHRAEDRVQALLVHLARRAGPPAGPPSGCVPLQFTHGDLASMAGMSRAHVSVAMNRLPAKGIVRYGRGMPLQVNLAAANARLPPTETPSRLFAI